MDDELRREISELRQLVRKWIAESRQWKAETREAWLRLEAQRERHHESIMRALQADDDSWWREGCEPW